MAKKRRKTKERLRKKVKKAMAKMFDQIEEELEEAVEGIEEAENKDEEEEIEDDLYLQFRKLIGFQVLVVTESQQLNLLGQTFRPIFCGEVVEVEHGHITLFPVTIKLLNAPFFNFPTPLSIPFEKMAHFTPDFDCEMRIPLV